MSTRRTERSLTSSLSAMSIWACSLSESRWMPDRVMTEITWKGFWRDPSATQAQVGRPVGYRPEIPDRHRPEFPDPTRAAAARSTPREPGPPSSSPCSPPRRPRSFRNPRPTARTYESCSSPTLGEGVRRARSSSNLLRYTASSPDGRVWERDRSASEGAESGGTPHATRIADFQRSLGLPAHGSRGVGGSDLAPPVGRARGRRQA